MIDAYIAALAAYAEHNGLLEAGDHWYGINALLEALGLDSYTEPAELPALADCPREDARFVLEQLYEADQAGRSLGREAILAAAREAGLPCSQQEVRRILAGLDRAGLVRVSRGRGGTRLTPAGRALCRRQAVEGGAEMV